MSKELRIKGEDLNPKTKEKIFCNERIDRKEALDLYHSASLAELRELATLKRNRIHDARTASYLIMAIINYTNVCVAKCDYCAFYKLPHQDGTYLYSFEDLRPRIDALLKLGGTMMGLNGGFHPKLRLNHYADLFTQIRKTYGERLEFYGMTVAEFMFTCKLEKISYAEGARYMRANGAHWITGGGAEILDDGFRLRHSPGKFKVADYFAAQRALIEAGVGTTATMVIGFDESIDERMNHIETLRAFQDDVQGAIPSFLCWTYKPWNTAFGGREIATEEYLRWLAVCRIYLDNIKHIRTSVLTKNADALLGLDYGANDFDLPTEDEVTQKAGATIDLEFQTLLQTARDLGYEPIKRKPFALPTLGQPVLTSANAIQQHATYT